MSHRNPQQKLWIALGVQVAKIMKGSASIAVAAFVLGASQARPRRSP
ncbi:MAG: hypothetical protein JWQ24_1550 [Tardiphaga sp.]|nr:hypothetical protein [Tardiphaga sp.]